MNPRLLLLTLCQGLYLTNNVTFIAVNGLVGLSLAPVPWMATLPVMGYVAGSALSAPLVARHQRRFGRRRCFQLGLLVAMAAAVTCAVAALTRQFWLLLAATIVAGPQLASGMRDALPQPFAGTYAALIGVALLSLLLVSRIEFPPRPWATA